METRRRPKVAHYEASARGMGGAGETEHAGARANSPLPLDGRAIAYGLNFPLSLRKPVCPGLRRYPARQTAPSGIHLGDGANTDMDSVSHGSRAGTHRVPGPTAAGNLWVGLKRVGP